MMRSPELQTRRLLVTGGAGFIGTHFVEHCLEQGLVERLVVLDSLTYAADLSSLDELRANSRFRFIQGDICNQALVEGLLREEGLDGIVNLAAETHVDRSIRNADVFVRSNVLGVKSLLEAARRYGAGSGLNHRFHQVSTDEVFGPLAPGMPRDESQPYAPQSPYSARKAAADHLVMAWRNTYGVQASISYSSNVYGPRQHPEKLIPLAISRLLEGRPVPVYGDGQHVRSWIHVQDLCRALAQFLACCAAGRRLFLGGDEECSNLQVLQMLCRAAGRAHIPRAGVRCRTGPGMMAAMA
ncbi:MAG: GDP-mannose 4,6-dehydratase [Proteobacteria bacterium]|nr:GDP-mannose 4,6-dehydratase [Pseudomonadota bacterium]